MKLHLQCGHGMKGHCLHLISKWKQGCAILSPRDLDGDQIKKMASEITTTSGGEILLDPQFYLPAADHQRLTSHDYWPNDYSTGSFWSGSELQEMLNSLIAKNMALGTSNIILPGVFAERMSPEWLLKQKDIATTARQLVPNGRLFSTIALGADVLRSDDQIHELLEELDDWPVNGVYIVAKHPQEEYLIEDSLWLVNLMDICAGIRLRGLSCIVGYACHQFIPFILTRANAIATGTYLNVRNFSTDKFDQNTEEDKKRKSVWYYAPSALSEYKKATLDLAKKAGVLFDLQPDPNLGSEYAEALFSGAQPTAVAFTEQEAFRHYLQCVHSQIESIDTASYISAKASVIEMLQSAKTRCQDLHRKGINGQARDFLEAADATISAVEVFDSVRGDQMKIEWEKLK